MSARAASANSSSLIPCRTRCAQTRSSRRRRRRWSRGLSTTPKWISASRSARVALDLVDRSLPGLEVDVGGRSRREDVAAGDDPDTGRVARIESAGAVDVADVVRRVAGSGEAVQPEHALPHDVEVLLRNGRQLAPERVERVAVEAPRAPLEPRRVDQVRRADFRHVHLQIGMLTDEHPRGARMVEMNVRQEQVAQVGERQPLLGEPRPSEPAGTRSARSRRARARPSSPARRHR